MKKSELMATHRKYQAYLAPLKIELRRRHLGFSEALILLALFFEKPHEVFPVDLSETLLLPKDQISHALKNLVQLGLIQTEISEKDRRKRLVKLTRKGLNEAPRLVAFFDSYELEIENSPFEKLVEP